ncbi:DegV family protein [Adlercreutzia sp. ZJ242]|uniref:DegV family protein n=1 Tax=Adlercreutzia sp. ZJ242 TaxID=2709409 RepID=UPI0013EA4389|nr:DegV family protein [Adlercreutzia sp. ZJ242]
MGKKEIAIVIDSCTDVPPAEIERYGMYVVPVQVNYEDGSYLDKVDITPQEVYDRLAVEVPRTSTPTPAIASEVLGRVVADGYEQAVVVTISSGLSSTHDLLRSVSSGMSRLRTLLVDTKNIGMGAGLVVLALARMVEAGATLEELEEAADRIVANTKVFFCVDTLDYLLRGGRIGKVTYRVGSLLDMRPVISCNEEGVYYTVSKAKGRKLSLKRAMSCAEKFAAQFDECVMAVVDGDAASEAAEVRRELKGRIANATTWYEGNVSPALVVHTGPGLIGVGVQGA